MVPSKAADLHACKQFSRPTLTIILAVAAEFRAPSGNYRVPKSGPTPGLHSSYSATRWARSHWADDRRAVLFPCPFRRCLARRPPPNH